MTNITTRTAKGSELSWAEMDANFTNLNTAKLEPDANGNLGLGVTPSAWGSGTKALELPNGSVIGFAGILGSVATNAYFNGTIWAYKTTNQAAIYTQYDGQHQWLNAPSGTAGNPITFAQAMMLDSSGNLTPGADNTQTLGSAAKRWSVVYAGTGTINTSDAREKTAVKALSQAEIAAAKALAAEIGTYQFLSALASKGGAARIHVGMTVQRAIEIMQAHGLDPMRYGFICHDQWDATFVDQVSAAGSLSRQVTRQVTIEQEQHSTRIDIIDGKPVQVRETTIVKVPQTDMLPVLDEAGQPVMTATPEVLAPDGSVQTPASQTPLLHPVPRMETVTERYDRVETSPAGDRYGFRPDELLLFMLRGVVA
jgi:hypothetical protein